jgi:hypothetical protein
MVDASWVRASRSGSGAASAIRYGCNASTRAASFITERLKNALALIEVRVLDHFIVSGEGYCGFVERGLLPCNSHGGAV